MVSSEVDTLSKTINVSIANDGDLGQLPSIQVQSSQQTDSELDLDPNYQIHNITYQSELEGQFIDSNGQWIELQPLYSSGSNFVQSVAQPYSSDSTSPNQNGPKSGEPDPIIEEIIDTQKYPDLRSEIEAMVK